MHGSEADQARLTNASPGTEEAPTANALWICLSKLLIRFVLAELFCAKHVREVVRCCVARTERSESKALLNRRQYRGRVVLGVIDDEVTAQERRDNQGGNVRAGSPLIANAWRTALSRW